ncbi:hypothetical protein KGQ20_05200 [Catenulispora sp. NF23]|uniref:Clp R domain-containing protein n=1 Tax=Catenulispora pinistramenti TaxID=2705254 RepID=A0ABS5KHT3_9ACTN|nr:Clp protease N-terminal domain-containing protein [Catenulispora pinistramenti]MBS2532163.1 hypothetical protein [Catenulispora pinistramenti]MBS2545435.1 hypothetical protein [Catenulispora pinistramenti]
MFERFTGEARQTVVVAQDSARLLGHPRIGTEHLLLGLLRGTDHAGARALAEAGITRDGVLATIGRLEQAGPESERDLAEKDAAALRTIGIDIDAVRAALEESFGPGALDNGPAHGAGGQGPWWRRRTRNEPPTSAPRGHIPFTPRAKKALELSLREALALKHGYIGTEHVLLGLIREDGTAVRILREEGVEPGRLRSLVLAELQQAG